MRSLDIAIVGFGRLAELAYVPALLSLDGVHVSGIADPLESARARAQRVFPEARLFRSPEELLAAMELDAVLVASPPSTHWRVWQLARERRLPVFMEKPFPLPENLAELESVAASNLPLMIDFNRRFWPLYRELARRCRDGSIGEPRSARFQLHVNIRQWSSVTDHRRNAAEGGALHDLGAQMVDLALTTLDGDVETVAIRTDTSGGQHSLINLRLATGIDVVCDVAYTDRTREQVEIHGSGGTLRILEPNMALRREPYPSPLHRLGAALRDGWTLAGRVLHPDRTLLRYSIRLAIEQFVDTLRRGASFSPGIRDALRTARILAAAGRTPARSEAVR